MQCTKCNSDNTQRLEVVFEGGTQNINTTSNSAGAGIGGSFGVGGIRTSTSGTSQTSLAQKASPPLKKGLMWPIIAMFIGLMCFGGGMAAVVFGLVLIGSGGYFAYEAMQYNGQQWPTLHQVWLESWLCHKCGTIYHQP
jgi:hypothetical protein